MKFKSLFYISVRARNAVAHQNNIIESDGSIHYKDTRKTLSELDRIIKSMTDIVEVFIDVLGEV